MNGTAPEAIAAARLEPILASFESDAVAHRRRSTRLLRRVGIPTILAIVLVEISSIETFWIRGPLMLPAVWVCFEIARGLRAYRDAFKTEVVAPVVKLVHEGLRYSPRGSIPRETFDGCGLFKVPTREFRGEDLVEGAVGETRVRFCEIAAWPRKRPWSWWIRPDSRREPPLFRGLFLVADFHKRTRGRTLVLPDAAEGKLGHWAVTLQALDRGRGELVYLEDPEFERLFKVYGDDQIEARYVLSTSMMRRLVEFRSKAESVPLLAFTDSKLYLAIPSERNRLEPPMRHRLIGFGSSACVRDEILEQIGGYVADVRFGLGVVDDLALNTRIWGTVEMERR